jgi:type VI secretion system protein ImpK
VSQDKTLADLNRELLLLGSQIANGTAQLPDANTLRQRVHALFEEMKSRAGRRGFKPADIEAAQYAVAAFIDEAILHSGWQEGPNWSAQTLQAMYFAEANAGVNFYTRLADQRRQSPEAAEVFYLCVLLGFRGQYRDPRVQAQLGGLVDDMSRELAKSPGKRLSPHGDPPDEVVAQGKSFPFLPVTAAALAVAVAVAALFFILIASSRGDAIELLTKLAKGA